MGLVSLPLILLTLFGIAIGELPRLRMNRATIALVGAVLLVAVGALPLDTALRAIDASTLILLFSMMILIAHLELAGFFDWVAAWIVARATSPRVLLGWIVVTSGVLAALFLNDTVVLMLTPLVLQVTLALKRNPVPYLLALATSANIGSVATITGNPQNILIGTSSGIPFAAFLLHLAPVALAGMGIAYAMIFVVYRAEFSAQRFETALENKRSLQTPLLRKTLMITAVLLTAFLLGAPIAVAALVAAAALLITRTTEPEEIFARVDWTLLIFFAGLFVVTGAIEYLGWSQEIFAVIEPIARGGVAPLAVVTVGLSNLISNVPAVMLFRPIVPQFSNPVQTWLTLAMASTLAGNLTLLGSVANLIVAESARTRGVKLSFREYLKVGVPITVLTVAVGIVWLSFV
jgi:Na+/H+ antiporter NhaD/arsenite permease-like protein